MIDLLLEEGITLSEKEQQLIVDAADAALKHIGRNGDVAILVTDEENIHRMNRDFRGVDRVTDVLSFPAAEGESVFEAHGFIGDIAICLKRAMEQAESFGHPLERELAFLTVHGCLHIMGFDHMEPADELVMRAHQRAIMKEMGLTVHE